MIDILKAVSQLNFKFLLLLMIFWNWKIIVFHAILFSMAVRQQCFHNVLSLKFIRLWIAKYNLHKQNEGRESHWSRCCCTLPATLHPPVPTMLCRVLRHHACRSTDHPLASQKAGHSAGDAEDVLQTPLRYYCWMPMVTPINFVLYLDLWKIYK